MVTEFGTAVYRIAQVTSTICILRSKKGWLNAILGSVFNRPALIVTVHSWTDVRQTTSADIGRSIVHNGRPKKKYVACGVLRATVATNNNPRAQKHLFHISSTKGLRPGIYASMIGDAKKAILQLLSFAILHSNVGVPVNTP